MGRKREKFQSTHFSSFYLCCVHSFFLLLTPLLARRLRLSFFSVRSCCCSVVHGVYIFHCPVVRRPSSTVLLTSTAAIVDISLPIGPLFDRHRETYTHFFRTKRHTENVHMRMGTTRLRSRPCEKYFAFERGRSRDARDSQHWRKRRKDQHSTELFVHNLICSTFIICQ